MEPEVEPGNGHWEEPEPHPEEQPEKPTRRARFSRWRREHPRRALGALLGLLLLAILGALLLRYLWSYERTDDAQIDAHIAEVAPRVTGTVLEVYVEDNQPVKAGQLLVELDPRDFQVAVERAQAELDLAEAQLLGAQPQVPITTRSNQTRVASAGDEVTNAEAQVAAATRDHQAALASVREAEAQRIRAEADRVRYQYLLGERATPQATFDQKLAEARAAAATVDSTRARARAAKKAVDQAQARLDTARSREAEATHNAPRELSIQHANIAARKAQVSAARAALERAQLDLGYTRIYAPVDGIVGKRSAVRGDRVSAGQALLAVVETGDLWVTANFKETQLAHLRIGQRARVRVDALRRSYDGFVESFGGASGAVFSLLPPENATGNFVKIVQRLPVRLRLRPGQPELERLRPGMSVEPKVFLK